MEVIYSFMELLPASMFQYDFMKNAFLASVLIAPSVCVFLMVSLTGAVAFFTALAAFCWVVAFF